MPIYAYRCDDCGFAQDVLQKMSDPLLVVCPSCGHSTFRKQVTAAGFQLKGSGWYVTDFRNPAAKEGKASADGDAAKSDAKDAPAADAKPVDGGDAKAVKPASDSSTPAPAAPAPAPAPAPKAATGGGTGD